MTLEKCRKNKEIIEKFLIIIQEAGFTYDCYDPWHLDGDTDDFDIDETILSISHLDVNDFMVQLKLDLDSQSYYLSADSGYFMVTRPRSLNPDSESFAPELVLFLRVALGLSS